MMCRVPRERDGAAVIDGTACARELMADVRRGVDALGGVRVGIATLLVGDDYAAAVYQRRIDRHAREAGMASRPERLPADASFGQVIGKIAEMDADSEISGILVLRPLPPHIDDALVFANLPVLKDVEAQHPHNAGLLALGMPRFIPSTPAAAFEMLDRYMRENGRDPETAYDGVDLVLVGRSNNVGKPAAILGLQRNATVISAHRHTSDAGRLADHTRRADLLIVAAGVPGLITGDMVKEGATVVDIGINPVERPDGTVALVGDVDFESVRQRAGAVSPVPGGVGPVTDVWVLRNALTAARSLSGPVGWMNGIGLGVSGGRVPTMAGGAVPAPVAGVPG
ncbi:MAG: methylenetetrahydrofolate dehydrogenase / methenyltetrahydrofolate cyclohydrolase [Solirubrobacteraceae bacterium]|jgi:methylenetetrahydrofolate dehydrogenase (NADP+)/methenyltetrahydrofolate cyclohydrolase|nr:methylenetetrahydrofolate dehydrogenase / methenyltetrahydrofolate cyclohydrolase [Solirubrobacteraceae bacterium]